MFALVLAAALSQVPPVQVAAPDLTVVNLSKERGTLFAEHLAQQLTALGLTVVTSKQMGALLGQERQKQLLGCDVSESCMAELASAMGSDAVVVGTVAKLETAFQVNVSIIAAKDGKPVTVLSTREPSEEAVLDAFSREAPRMAQETISRIRVGHALVLPRKGPRPYAWIPAAAGALLVGTSGIMLAGAWGDSDRLRGTGLHASEAFTLEQARTLAESAQSRQTLGVVLGTAGVAALLTAGGLALFGADTPASIAVGPTSSGFGIAVAGRLP